LRLLRVSSSQAFSSLIRGNYVSSVQTFCGSLGASPLVHWLLVVATTSTHASSLLNLFPLSFRRVSPPYSPGVSRAPLSLPPVFALSLFLHTILTPPKDTPHIHTPSSPRVPKAVTEYYFNRARCSLSCPVMVPLSVALGYHPFFFSPHRLS